MKRDGYLSIGATSAIKAVSILGLGIATLGLSVPARAATVRISIQDLVFMPAATAVKVGDTIEWVNEDIFAHTATARNGDWDVTLPPQRTIRLVLKKAGTIDYYCRFHPNMKARLTIAP
ncbi:cupredoxin domain-containing protein [Nitrobacter sp. TKz-YC01]|uniref:cupredoxin domain-containing protein n=1 Tax=Nitrobacter sp. TKz-YC01 TaxID=3398703 RepID=UPI003A0FD85C